MFGAELVPPQYPHVEAITPVPWNLTVLEIDHI